MPDETGRLTPEDNAKISAWWSRHWKEPVICPVCKTAEWALGAHVVTVPRHGQNWFAPYTETYPHIIVGCKTCAHAMFFNAVQIGISPAYVAPPPPSSLIAGVLSPQELWAKVGDGMKG